MEESRGKKTIKEKIKKLFTVNYFLKILKINHFYYLSIIIILLILANFIVSIFLFQVNKKNQKIINEIQRETNNLFQVNKENQKIINEIQKETNNLDSKINTMYSEMRQMSSRLWSFHAELYKLKK